MSDPIDDLRKTMKRAKMTDKERIIDDLSSVIASIVILLLGTTSFWGILHLIFLLPVTWLQVWGALVLFGLVKSLFR